MRAILLTSYLTERLISISVHSAPKSGKQAGLGALLTRAETTPRDVPAGLCMPKTSPKLSGKETALAGPAKDTDPEAFKEADQPDADIAVLSCETKTGNTAPPAPVELIVCVVPPIVIDL